MSEGLKHDSEKIRMELLPFESPVACCDECFIFSMV
jgi:hypothetical protein